MAIENLITDHLDLWTAAVRPKSSVGRGSNSKLELTGIKKLRELILDLAVRGKLVPQDPSDEPASVLLERIAAEKMRLVKEGKIKKPKALPEISEEEKPFELPVGWTWIKLGNAGIGSTGKTPSTANHAFFNGVIPFIGPGQISISGELLDTDKNLSELGLEHSAEANNGDILMVCIGGSIGKAVVANKLIAFNQQINAIRPIEINSKFLLAVMTASFFYKVLLEKATGSATPIINRGKWEELPIPIAPIQEQHRIVAKVDELMAIYDQLELQCEAQLAAHQTLVEALLTTLTDSGDAGELAQNWARLSTHFDTLFTTEASIDALKQTILQLAVMGKLVPQDPSDKPASALLERIAAEKAQLVKEKKIKKEKPLPAICEDDKPFELPQGWEWCYLRDLITIMDAGWSPACPPEASPDIDTWGVLKTTAVQALEYREYENKVLDKTKTPRPEYEVMVGDILITRAGPKNRVGISCLVEKTRPKLMISDKIIRFHLVGVGLSERFISLCLNAGATAAYIDGSKSGMAESQMNISQDKLKFAPIPLGPIREQNHIMNKVDELMALCDQLKARLQTSQQTQLALAESLVEGALA
ncbi:restriction endonuclease subunit S [Aeromonas sp. MR7]|uniref:restriction endonuclease subunit S n=1 Tax=Aeromonas sp. MR7 TaxID=2923419 RepID=UPI001F4A3901|nr:restriction endonuclease subunit S [Aeromonas sp. MR7]MCH7349987.1 restriction endonuclease subunit S [Aeromonas sp. MR7]